MKKSGFERFFEVIIWTVRHLLLGILTLFLSRLIFTNWADRKGYTLDIIRAFLVGLKFDIKVLTIASVPLVALALVGSIHNKNQAYQAHFSELMR